MSSVQSNHHASSPLCSGNKSKKSKTDILRAAVGRVYLKQKNFVGSEKYRKSDFSLLQNKKNFALQKMIDSDLHGGNSFVYSNVLCLTNNYNMVDQQFAKFSQFIESQPEDMRMELKRFYAPLLCHLYVELIKGRETKAAVDFLRKYSHLVAAVDTYEAPFPTKINGCSVPSTDMNMESGWQHLNIRFAREAFAEDDVELDFFMKLIQKLSACQKLETLEQDAEVAQYRSSKYEIHTSEAVVNALKAFLEKRGHVLILNLIYTWIHVHIIDNEVKQLAEDTLFMPTEETQDENDDEMTLVKPKSHTSSSERNTNKRPAEEPAVGDSQQIKTEIDANETKDVLHNVKDCMKTLKESREQMFKNPLEFPRIVKIADKNQGLTSACMDPLECHLVAGFNNSVIQLWELNQHSTRGKNLYERLTTSHCRWNLNNFCEENEDEMDESIKEMHKSKNLQEEYLKEKYYEKKYEDNSYNFYGGVTLRGHGAGVTDVRFSQHYPIIYSTSKDKTMRCWKAANLQCAGIYRGHHYPIWCMDESLVGMYVATGSKDLTARLWSLEREFPLITYAGHTQDVECLAFHPNGNYIATGSSDSSVRLWCVTSGKLMRVFSDCKQPVCSITFSPDGKMLAAGGEETKIRIFDLAAGSQLNELKDHTATVTNIVWSSNGRHLASGCRDGSLRVWDVKKLSAMSESSSSSSSSSTTLNRIIALPTSCQRLVKVTFTNNDCISCLGT
ncbi:TAF5-like RNA polymerase II p300/CBP-associated factor-associated factor 65 kDa subunit 5L [Stomoxys calcitrans]|uniref:TAF5-like RNA polymerase II p300/CBP-associated factor-associated factor 65 kDa subunit 5L n=1 Tax=Stomoxys calcitrans TaxID=35570 RepID=UPI0027E33142|nr:TAF5-like RNA polymerase II p300/CBP-associated factor-associated factor 65 kDa subunit 5L [Stomoxys calcitrans]